MLQMFSLMDRLLKDENLDLKLTPYKCSPPLLPNELAAVRLLIHIVFQKHPFSA